MDEQGIGWAVKQMQNGDRVARSGWNGKGMFLFLVPGSKFLVNRAPLLGIYCAACLLGQIPASLWVLYGQARYGWAPSMVGWSFACFGLLFAVSQAFLAGPLTARVGERGCLRTPTLVEGDAESPAGEDRTGEGGETVADQEQRRHGASLAGGATQATEPA